MVIRPETGCARVGRSVRGAGNRGEIALDPLTIRVCAIDFLTAAAFFHAAQGPAVGDAFRGEVCLAESVGFGGGFAAGQTRGVGAEGESKGDEKCGESCFGCHVRFP